MDFEEELLKAILRFERELGHVHAELINLKEDLLNHTHGNGVSTQEYKENRMNRKVTIGSVATAIGTVVLWIGLEVAKWF